MTKTELIEHYKLAFKGHADESIRVPGNSILTFASVAGIRQQCDNAKNGDKIYMMLPNGISSYEVLSFLYTEKN